MWLPLRCDSLTNTERDAPKLVVHGLVHPISWKPATRDRRQHRPRSGSASKPAVPRPTFLLELTGFGSHDRRTWGCNRLIFSLTGHDGRRPRGKSDNKPARPHCECTSSTSEVVVLGRAGPDLAVGGPESGYARVSRRRTCRRRVRNRGSDRGKIPDQPYMHETLKHRNISLCGWVPPATIHALF